MIASIHGDRTEDISWSITMIPMKSMKYHIFWGCWIRMPNPHVSPYIDPTVSHCSHPSAEILWRRQGHVDQGHQGSPGKQHSTIQRWAPEQQADATPEGWSVWEPQFWWQQRVVSRLINSILSLSLSIDISGDQQSSWRRTQKAAFLNASNVRISTFLACQH